MRMSPCVNLLLIHECKWQSSNWQEMGKFLLTFVRHGETEYNRKGLLQGQIDIPLNETGLKQADALGRYLAQERFDRVYSSDLSRCVQTAEGVIRNGAIPRPSIVKDARLRERNYGEAEGMPREETKKKRAGPESPGPMGAESRKQVVDRGLSFLHDLCQDVHKEYGHEKDYRSRMASGSYSVQDEDEVQEDEKNVEEGDSFEVVFASEGNGPPTDDAVSSDATQNSVLQTKGSVQKDVANAETQLEGACGITHMPNSAAAVSRNCSDSQPSTTSHAIGGTAAVSSNNKMLHSPIFRSHLTGMNSTPPYCPHIFISSHGYFLRALFQTLQKRYKIGFPGGNSILRSRCPNTGLSSFVFSLDSDGFLSDVECYFVYAIDHLEGIEVIQV